MVDIVWIDSGRVESSRAHFNPGTPLNVEQRYRIMSSMLKVTLSPAQRRTPHLAWHNVNQ